LFHAIEIRVLSVRFQLAIVLDGVLYSAPRIMGEIPGGRGIISGSFSPEEALELASILQHPLAVRLKVLETRQY